MKKKIFSFAPSPRSHCYSLLFTASLCAILHSFFLSIHARYAVAIQTVPQCHCTNCFIHVLFFLTCIILCVRSALAKWHLEKRGRFAVTRTISMPEETECFHVRNETENEWETVTFPVVARKFWCCVCAQKIYTFNIYVFVSKVSSIKKFSYVRKCQLGNCKEQNRTYQSHQLRAHMKLPNLIKL